MNAGQIYYLDDIPTPYRLGVQRRIAAQWPGVFHIAYCAESEPGRSWELDFSGLDVEFLPGRQWRPPVQRNPFSFKWNPTVIESLEAFSPDVVVLSGYAHSTMRRAAHWCRRRGVPYGIACETSCRSSHCSGWRWWLKKGLVGPMVKGMAFGLPVGREAADYLHRLGGGNQPMHYFPNTPDTSRIVAEARLVKRPGEEAALRQELGIPEGKKIVLFVGRLIDAKRPMDAVAAFLRLRAGVAEDAVLVVVGDGPLRTEMEQRANGNPDIIFSGWLTDPVQIARLMAISSVMVLPSGHEPWGAVVNEAMAAGTAVVASDKVCAAIELIEEGENGFVFPVGDIGKICEALESILSDEMRCRQMGEKAQSTAEEHGHEFAASNFLQAVEAVVGK